MRNLYLVDFLLLPILFHFPPFRGLVLLYVFVFGPDLLHHFFPELRCNIVSHRLIHEIGVVGAGKWLVEVEG